MTQQIYKQMAADAQVAIEKLSKGTHAIETSCFVSPNLTIYFTKSEDMKNAADAIRAAVSTLQRYEEITKDAP